MEKRSLDRYLRKVEQRIGKRVNQFLRLSEQDSVYDFSETSPYSESILSQEVKRYFANLAVLERGEDTQEKQNVKAAVLEQIFNVLSMDAFERMCVELAVLGEVNSYFEKFFIFMNNDWNNAYLTPDTAVKLYTMEQITDAGYFRYFMDGSKLLQYFFEFSGQQGKGRVRWGLKCRETFFQSLFLEPDCFFGKFSFVKWCYAGENDISGYVDFSVFSQFDVIARQEMPVIYIYGAGQSGKKEIVTQYGKLKGHDICLFDIKKLAYLTEKNLLNGMLEDICNDISLQLTIRNAWICFYSIDTEFWNKESNRQMTDILIDLFQSRERLVFITGEQSSVLAEHNSGIWEVPLEAEDMVEDIRIWEKLAGRYDLEEDAGLEFFAGNYRFTPIQIEHIFQNAEKRRLLKNYSSIRREDIKESCIWETTNNNSNQLVTMVNAGYHWEDLVLPERQREQLRAACSRILHKRQIYYTWGFGQKVAYGKGVSMIFSGPPGTGKTMSAGIIADYLGTTLFRVDLAAVVSKYIGETEKNLSEVFAIAKKGQGVLFFDEADVLFSKRTEVNNSNDKHSNMEAAYLLQKMEEYEGIVILATNYMQNMDEAFKRRIQFFIEFTLPDEVCRRTLWEKVFPEQTEFDEEPDYDFLAKQFELSGSHIKNIALQAAFFAADEKKGVNMKHIIKALLLEIRKTGKRVSREDLREYYIYYE